MLVKATRKGYYGNRIRKMGQSFNYKPKSEKAVISGKEKLPSWMEAVTVKDKSSEEEKNDNLIELSKAVEAAQKTVKKSEDIAKNADEVLDKADDKNKDEAQAKCEAANEQLDNDLEALSESESALAKAESE